MNDIVNNSGSPGASVAGDLSLTAIGLVDTKNKNQYYNLLGSFVDFTIYEDLYAPSLTGYIAIIENQNLISSIPITGGEYILAEMQTPGKSDKIFAKFVVTSVGVVERSDRSLAYTLDLLSYEGFIDLNLKFSVPIFGNPATIATTFYQNTFNKKLVDVDQCSNNIKFIAPYWNPFKILGHVAAKALYPNKSTITPNFLFFQTTRGHKFKSLSVLLSQNLSAVFTYDKNAMRVQDVDGSSTRNVDREYKTIKQLTHVAYPCFIKNTLTGAFNHQLYTVDLFTKKVGLKTYSYKDEFSNTVHTNDYPLTPKFVPNVGLHSVQITNTNGFTGITDASADILSKRIPLLAQLETFKLNIVIPGNSDLEVGKMIGIFLPLNKTLDKTDILADNYDEIYSGNYLITAISHRFTMSKYFQNLQVIKDSSLSQIKVQ